MKKAIVELVLLGVLSVVLAFTVNQLRTYRSIKPTKNYFQKTADVGQPQPDSAASTSRSTKAESPKTPSTPPPAAERSAQPAALPAASKAKKLEHDYQEITFEEVAKAFKDPATKQGLNVFVDARKHDDYDEGHIPGAMNCDPYDAQKTMDEVVDRTNAVERVIVYCGGGECEDSIFMCRELVAAGVPQDSIYLYPGGFTEWSERNMPVEVGHEEGHEE